MSNRTIIGADVDNRSLTRQLMSHLESSRALRRHYLHQVTGLAREPGGRWRVL